MSNTTVETIRTRCNTITKRINSDYWSIDSDSKNRLYVGSYGRGTEIWVSDIDLLVILPNSFYHRFNDYTNNGQSALLNHVKDTLRKTYSTSFIKGDGQVVGIKFSDGIEFEVVPAFSVTDGSFLYPDTNNGGSWKVTNPRAEIKAMNELNVITKKNLKNFCRMIRAWKETNNVQISGILLDTLAYKFLENWKYKDKGYVYYDWMTRDFFNYLMNQDINKEYWLAPGSNRRVYKTGNFQNKAQKAFNLAVSAIQDEEKYPALAKSNWRAIYGTKFPN
ncbi:nucleotidyltransferase domain-containing protein [Vitreoscilla massiliensis]|uniref:Nucleotidyltransferase domain-containing protein n=2 Tax=Vitreoscilla massiliensis TaxID=1689272 RepID=A0ABY4E1J9_9NEIS|nr:nucleotidyltransferase domain-containing protein [Vitreoscilla massiliensis]UOO89188.1 nucleotidyltransferase domain-containing protein [Vitreoscilla massiliensis]